MIIVGMALVWAGYTGAFYGYCLVRGYGITFTQVASPTKFWKQAWPPGCASSGEIFPTGAGSPPGSGCGGQQPGTPASLTGGLTFPKPSKGRQCPPGYQYSSGQCLPSAFR